MEEAEEEEEDRRRRRRKRRVYPQKVFSHKIVSREALYLVSNYIPPVPQKIVSLLQLLPVTILV